MTTDTFMWFYSVQVPGERFKSAGYVEGKDESEATSKVQHIFKVDADKITLQFKWNKDSWEREMKRPFQG